MKYAVLFLISCLHTCLCQAELKKYFIDGVEFFASEEEFNPFCRHSFEIERIWEEEGFNLSAFRKKAVRNLDDLQSLGQIKTPHKIPQISHHIWFTNPKHPQNLSPLHRKFLREKIRVLNMRSPDVRPSASLGMTGDSNFRSPLGMTGDANFRSPLGMTGDAKLRSSLGMTGEFASSSKMRVKVDEPLKMRVKVDEPLNSKWRSILWVNTEEGIQDTLQLAQELNMEVKNISSSPSPFLPLIHKMIDEEEFGMASDIWRVQVMKDWGGFYSDNDYELRGSIEDLTRLFHFFAGFDDYSNRYIGNSVIAASKNHPILQAYYKRIYRNIFGTTEIPEYVLYPCNRFSRTIMTTGPTAFSLSVTEAIHTGNFRDIVFPHGYIFHLKDSVPDFAKSKFEKIEKGECKIHDFLELQSTCVETFEHMGAIGNDQYSGSWISNKSFLPVLLKEQGLLSEYLTINPLAIPRNFYLPYDFSERLQILETLRTNESLSNEDCTKALLKYLNPNTKNLAIGALEYGPYKVGGVASIVNTLTPLVHRQLLSFGTFSSYFVGPYYSNGKALPQSAEKICELEHIFHNEKTRAQVYKTEVSFKMHHGSIHVPAFLIDANERYPHLFEIDKPSDVYTTNEHSSFYNRLFYFNSAFASLLSLLKVDGKTLFDIVHTHTIGASLANSLLNPEKPRPKTIGHLHNLNLDQGYFDEYQCRGNEYCNLMQNLILDSDHVLTVSQSMIKEGLNPDIHRSFFLHEAYVKAIEEQRMSPLPNGIIFSTFDPSKTLGEFSFDWKKDNIAHAKFQIKKHYLQNKKYIADSRKPLFLFVARYSQEKGTDVLKFAADLIKKRGGSLIVMGVRTNHDNIHIRELREIYKEDPDVYVMQGDYIKEQANAENTGLLIRAAADFMLVPSHEEAFGLVPIEGFAMGALAITSSISGMKDYIRDFDIMNLEYGNSFNYDEVTFPREFKMQFIEEALREQIENAFFYYESSTEKERSDVSRRLILESQKWDWLDSEGSVQKFISVLEGLSS